MKKNPSISVIMPFYNAEKFLAEAITSILGQTFSDFELIIINDASTDTSDKIVVEFQRKDERICYIRNKNNLGISHNRNLGLAMAKADVIAYMDGDDISEPDRLEKQFIFLKNNPSITVVGTFVCIIDEEGNEIERRVKITDPEYIKNNLIIYNPLTNPSTMFLKEPVLLLGGHRNNYPNGSDLDLWYRLTYSGYAITNIPEFLLKYRYHKNSTSKSSMKNAWHDFLRRLIIIKEFRVKVSLRLWALIIAQLLVGIILSGRQRQNLECVYSQLFIRKNRKIKKCK